MVDIKFHTRTKIMKLVAKVLQIFLKLKHELRKVKLDLSSSKEGVEGKSKLEVSKG